MTWWQWIMAIGGGWTALSFVVVGLYIVAAHGWHRGQTAMTSQRRPDATAMPDGAAETA